MKHIHRIGQNQYVHLDSYPENQDLKLGDVVANTIMVAMVIGIAAMTAGAMVGVDITNPQLPSVQRTK